MSDNLQSNKDDFLRFNSVIENQSSTLDIGLDRHRLNKTTFANASHIYKINDNWAGRLIMNFMRDDLFFRKSSNTRYIIPDSLDIHNQINELAHKNLLFLIQTLSLRGKIVRTNFSKLISHILHKMWKHKTI